MPPFQQVLVQHTQPVPGQVYNVLYVAVKNGTAQTFTAADGFTVRLPGNSGGGRGVSDAFPVLTGDQVWKPNTWMVFYVLTKKYYPLSPQVAAGFQLDAGGRISTMVPGPSGIFLRLTYNPATFAKTLDWIVAYGPGAGGRRCEARPARHRDQRAGLGEDPPDRFRRPFLTSEERWGSGARPGPPGSNLRGLEDSPIKETLPLRFFSGIGLLGLV